MTPYRKLPDGIALVMRTCNADLTAHGGFRWPAGGPIECPDWQPIAECGNGLHGLLWGGGDSDRLDWSPDAKWLVVAVWETDVIEIDRKVKFPRGWVLHVGDRYSATNFLSEHERAIGRAIHAGTATAGDDGTATAGVRGEIRIRFYDAKNERYRTKVGYIGEDGIEADTPYRLDATNNFVKAEKK
jgi:hypothetical protein